MEAASAQITDLDGRFRSQLLFDRSTPLLDILRRRVQLKGGEAGHGCADHRRGEVERSDRGNEGIALRGLGEDERLVVALVAPGVHIDRRVEDAVGNVRHKAQSRNALRQAQPWREPQPVGIHQASRISVLAADEDLGHAIVDCEVAVGVSNIDERAHELVAAAVGQRGRISEAPGILREAVNIPLAQLHLGNGAGLRLADSGQPQQEAGEGRSCGAVVERILGGIAVGVLVIAARLHEGQHRPDKSLIHAAKLGAVAAHLPVQRIPALGKSVPHCHGSGEPVVAEGRISLHVEVGCAPLLRVADQARDA